MMERGRKGHPHVDVDLDVDVRLANSASKHGLHCRSWKSRAWTAAVVTLLALAFAVLASHRWDFRYGFFLQRTAPTREHHHETTTDDHIWVDIRPSRTLKWHSCYDGQYDCARLDLPMDWLEPSDDQRVVLAIMRLRANSSSALGSYRGPVIFNPGGPGGSGIWSLRDHGRVLQTVVGDNHDVVSFDPRGVGASVPRIECWDSVQARRFWELQEVGVIDSRPGVVFDAFARAEALSLVCERALRDSGILRHSGTAYHARDMLALLDQLGERQLKYWGFSYGTVLGGAFAALYPHRVGRMVNDGNVDYGEWFAGARVNHPRDADKVMAGFFAGCAAAGPRRCAFHAPTPAAVEARLDALLADLSVRPVIVSPDHNSPDSNRGPDMPELITYSHVKRLVASTLYQPLRAFPRLATVLAALADRRDGAPFYDLVLAGSSGPGPGALCALPPAVPPSVPRAGPDLADTPDAFAAVHCADAPPLTDAPREFADGYAARLRNLSRAAGAVFALVRLGCAGRAAVRPRWRPFDGGLAAAPPPGTAVPPILFVANAADNVTPLVSARNNSAAFPGSRVLVLDALGHTSLAAPSECVARAVRGYFQTGEMPAEGTVCAPDEVPFGEERVVAEGGGEAGGGALRRAAWRLSMEAEWPFMKPPRLYV